MLPLLIAVAIAFVLLFAMRLGAARRTELLKRWPALAMGAVALLLLLRGVFWPGMAFAAFAALAWVLEPRLMAPRQRPAVRPDDPEDLAARAILGVGGAATTAEIRSAYRAKMRAAHPDRGGDTAAAQRLTAARDRLLKRR